MSRFIGPASAALVAFLLCPPASLAGEAVPAAAHRAHPKISVFVNDSKEMLILKGWPLIVRVAVESPVRSPAGEKKPIVLEAAEDWTDIVRVEVRDSHGKTCDWPLQKITPAATRPRLNLGPGSGETVSFVAGPKATKQFDAGFYEITAVVVGFDSAPESTALVRIMDHPESLSPQGEEARNRFMAMYRALTGEETPAAAPLPRAAPAARPTAARAPPPPPPPSGGNAPAAGEVAAGILSAVGSYGSYGYGDFANPYVDDWTAPDIPDIPDIPDDYSDE